MGWLAWGLGALGPGVAVVWLVIEGDLRPRLIPREEIEALADAVMRAHPDDPEDGAFAEEEAAWYRSTLFEQGRWRRVRRVLRARLAQRP